MKLIVGILTLLIIISCESQKGNSAAEEKRFDLKPLKVKISMANKSYGDRFLTNNK